jgi:hypothetical protein
MDGIGNPSDGPRRGKQLKVRRVTGSGDRGSPCHIAV